MNKLIEFFNEKYGDKYGKIPYPRTTMQIYRVYQSIKSYGIKDEELVKLLHNIKLPKPKSIEEKELYTDCLYNKDDSEMVIDTSNLISKENPVFTGSMSMNRKEGATIGEYSVAIGKTVEASGECSYAEGKNTTASGWSSHAEGEETKAYGKSSHAEGSFTTASSNYQHVQGKYNIEDKSNKYAHIVGNGKSGMERSNAHTLDWKGNAWFAGKLSQEGTPTEDKDLVTKKYVDDSRDNLISNIYGRVYDFQITEDEFNSLYDFVYNYLWIDKPNNEIILNSISKEDLNQVIDDDIGYEAILFNNKIILELNSTGSNGITLYNKFESAEGSIYYYLFSLKSNESNVTIFSFNNSIKYNYSDKIITMATISNKVNLVTNTKNQYINVTEDLEITLPNVVEYTEIHLYFSPSSTVSITFPPSIKWKDVPTIEANKVYEIIFKYINEKIGWIGEYKIYN